MKPRGVSPVERQARGDFSALFSLGSHSWLPGGLALWGMGLSGHCFTACSIRGAVELEVVGAQKTWEWHRLSLECFGEGNYFSPVGAVHTS